MRVRNLREPRMTVSVPANDPQTAIRDIVERIEPALIEIRRDIHAHPELAFEEVRTAGVVARELQRLGIQHQTGVAKTGVVGLIEGGRPGKVLIIRADMDALPIHEQTGLAYASTIDGKMHACGHDIHTTTLLGVAAVLQQLAPQLAGTVKLVFQPAEEAIGGMKVMLQEGLLDGPKVDFALGFHNRPNSPAGEFTFTKGRLRLPCMANPATPRSRIIRSIRLSPPRSLSGSCRRWCRARSTRCIRRW